MPRVDGPDNDEIKRWEISKRINNQEYELRKKYPEEVNNSISSLWIRALNDRIISKELFTKAKKYYGILWNYAGD